MLMLYATFVPADAELDTHTGQVLSFQNSTSSASLNGLSGCIAQCCLHLGDVMLVLAK